MESERCPRCFRDDCQDLFGPWKPGKYCVNQPDLVGELKRVRDELRLAESVVEALPKCSGKWTGGSGAHRTHDHCGRLATWYHPDDCWAYCDEHVKDWDKRGDKPLGLDEVHWADEARALDAHRSKR